jgi:hypothetical protein
MWIITAILEKEPFVSRISLHAYIDSNFRMPGSAYAQRIHHKTIKLEVSLHAITQILISASPELCRIGSSISKPHAAKPLDIRVKD